MEEINMFVIFNNDVEHPVKMTDGRYDYMGSHFYFKNTIPEEQTDEMINYIKALQNTTINSIEIQRRNHDFVISFKDLHAHIVNINKDMEANGGDSVFIIFNIDIVNEE